MSAEHTPGPWEAVSGVYVRTQYGPKPGIGGYKIADVFAGEAYALPAEVRRANAKLIAAAPQLKLCLKKVLADYRTLAGHDDRLVDEASLALAFAGDDSTVGGDQGGNLPTEDEVERARRQTPLGVGTVRGIIP